jgi:hypothetical protein
MLLVSGKVLHKNRKVAGFWQGVNNERGYEVGKESKRDRKFNRNVHQKARNFCHCAATEVSLTRKGPAFEKSIWQKRVK